MRINLINYLMSIICLASIYLFHKFLIKGTDSTSIIAAFGASVVLSFSTNEIRHTFYEVFLSSTIASIIGVFVSKIEIPLVYQVLFILSSFILIINFIKVSYPPAGAIAIIPVLSGEVFKELGYLYVLYPTLTGLIIIYTLSKIKEKLNIIYHGT